MKRYLTIAITGILILMARMPCSSAEGYANQLKTIMQTYDAVIFGNHDYCQCEYDQNGEYVRYKSLTNWYDDAYQGQMALSIFCVIDLDADGYPELILEIADSEGYPFDYEVLHFENGTVYGFCYGNRAMEDITREGDIAGSDGAFDNRWYKIAFNDGKAIDIETCHMQSTNEYLQYFIGQNEVTEKEYESFTGIIDKKERPMWLEFSKSNFEKVVAKF